MVDGHCQTAYRRASLVGHDLSCQYKAVGVLMAMTFLSSILWGTSISKVLIIRIISNQYMCLKILYILTMSPRIESYIVSHILCVMTLLWIYD